MITQDRLTQLQEERRKASEKRRTYYWEHQLVMQEWHRLDDAVKMLDFQIDYAERELGLKDEMDS